MKKADLDKHGAAICALITKTGTYSGPVVILRESIDEVLNVHEFSEVVIHLASSGFATVREGIFSLTEKGVAAGNSFRESMEIHKAANRHHGRIDEELN